MRQKFIWGTVVLFSLVAVAEFFGYLWAKGIQLIGLDEKAEGRGVIEARIDFKDNVHSLES